MEETKASSATKMEVDPPPSEKKDAEPAPTTAMAEETKAAAVKEETPPPAVDPVASKEEPKATEVSVPAVAPPTESLAETTKSESPAKPIEAPKNDAPGNAPSSPGDATETPSAGGMELAEKPKPETPTKAPSTDNSNGTSVGAAAPTPTSAPKAVKGSPAASSSSPAAATLKVKSTVAAKAVNPKAPSAAAPKTTPKTAGLPKKPASDAKSLKKGARKKRKAGVDEVEDKAAAAAAAAKKKKLKRKKEKEEEKKLEKAKKPRKQPKKGAASATASGTYPYADQLLAPAGMSAAQLAVQEQMRRALEEDQYSANGSIVDTDTDDDENQYMYKGQSIRLDRAYLLQAAKKYSWLGDAVIAAGSIAAASFKGGATATNDEDTNFEDPTDVEEGILNEDGSTNNAGSGGKKKPSRTKGKKGRNQYTNRNQGSATTGSSGGFRIDDKPNKGFVEVGKPKHIAALEKVMDTERDEGSIFGQTTGSSNSTWVECDKCKKWRRLRGVVDERKLPPKWYCTMNKNDPERARCSAPEEEYDAAHTPESAADARTRKHLRVWVRRLQCNEQYESRLPTLTRNKKRSVASSSKEPHEWIRCCNPSCGKWRAILRIMDAKQNVIDRTNNGEWYCVMNTWDEKTASCAAPQENLPAVGCPPWVMQDEN